MFAKLEILHGAKSKSLTVRLPTVIGRGQEARLKLPASTVSRFHCEVYDFEGQIAVRDLKSANGTYVNGHRITVPTFLGAHDDLTVGPVTFRLVPIATPATPVVTEQTGTSDMSSRDSSSSNSAEPTESSESMGQAKVPLAEDLASIPNPDESVLRYAEPADSGHSFLDIETEKSEDATESKATTVSPSDPALQEFLRNLGE